MKTMGIRDLKAHMSEAIKEVREGETIQVTSHGEVVALLVPVRRRPGEGEIHAALSSLDALAAEIGRRVPQPTNIAETISEMRR